MCSCHRATKPGARLFMFEFSPHNVNSIQWVGIPADNFEVLNPLPADYRVHIPVWSVVATRLD